VRRAIVRLGDFSIIILATGSLWFFWSQYSYLSGLSWWYENTQTLPARTAPLKPDYDLTTLPWKVANPRVFEVERGTMTLATSKDPFGYQAFAIINRAGADAADIQFDVDVEAGGLTVGLLQAGKWIAVNSTPTAGSFANSNSAQLGYQRSLTVMIANNNPAGESRATVRSLRVFLRK
jgi:hypothetical protein